MAASDLTVVVEKLLLDCLVNLTRRPHSEAGVKALGWHKSQELQSEFPGCFRSRP